MKTDARFKTVRVGIGQFDVYWDGQKTAWGIYNGSLGLSGRNTRNVYGIENHETGKFKVVGPLNSCKALLAHTLAKRAKEAGA